MALLSIARGTAVHQNFRSSLHRHDQCQWHGFSAPPLRPSWSWSRESREGEKEDEDPAVDAPPSLASRLTPLRPCRRGAAHSSPTVVPPRGDGETRSRIGRLVLVRHGQSEWNVTDQSRNLTARFTGWADVGLTQQGREQAVAAGRAIRSAAEGGIIPSRDDSGPAIDVVFCSLLRRSIHTMNIILEEIGLVERIATESKRRKKNADGNIFPMYRYPIPVIHSWRLNERHYGALVGLSKEGAERLYGPARLSRWRDSWDIPPPPMPLDMVRRWGKEDHCRPVTIVKRGEGGRTCIFDPSSGVVARMQNKRIVEHGGRRRGRRRGEAAGEDDNNDDEDFTMFMPPSESLRDTYERFLPLWTQGIAPHVRAGRTVLLVGHANTIRSMLFAIDGDVVTRARSKKIKIPSALPLIYEFIDRDGGNRPRDLHDDKAYEVDGRECTDVVPGGLRVVRPHRAGARDVEELRHQLNGIWVETEETRSTSFCTEVGQRMGEHEIA